MRSPSLTTSSYKADIAMVATGLSGPSLGIGQPSNPRGRTSAYTGSSAFRLPSPIRSTSTPIYGPTTGMFLAKPAMVPKKSPKRTKIPHNSRQKPISVHRKNMRRMPAKKAAVPLAFCFRAKKRSVFCGPMMIVRPIRNSICRGSRSGQGSSTTGVSKWI
jgi:hypothetical protein